MLACSAATWAADEVTAVIKGNNVEVALTNETSFVAFQMDITLPAGVEVGELTKAGRLAAGNDVTINGVSTPTPFVLASNVISTTADSKVLRVLAYNLGNNAIMDATGNLFTVALSAAPESATINNILFVKASDLAEIALAAAEAQKGADFLVGDVVVDGVVNTQDIMAVVNLVLGKNSGNYNTDAADAVADGVINTQDVMAVINIVKNSTK